MTNLTMYGLKKMKNTKNKRTIITPWNFNKIVNTEISGQKFIERMLSKCSYLHNETVLPKNSFVLSIMCFQN